ncbi:MAG: DUF4870 domain-containing protein [Pirellulales bacterium]|nr:DUF4870 domain-containing protein [Pirellulales bacterium]
MSDASEHQPNEPPVPESGTVELPTSGESEETPAPETDKDARMWGLFCHLSALSGYIGIPFGQIVGPLIVWLLKKDEMPFVDYHGKESLNFNITVSIALIVCIPLTFCFFIGLILIIPIAIAALVFTIIAAIKANSGEYYRYPMTLRLIK